MTIKESKAHFQRPVQYQGRIYILSELILWYDTLEKVLRYSANLIDQAANSVFRVPLEMVEPAEQKEGTE